MTDHRTREFTGWHAFGIFAGGFGIIIAVNITLAVQAVATFPGLETRNSYVSSQSFDADRAAQDGLGWTVETQATGGTLRLAITDASGQPVHPASVEATLGRATHVGEDQTPAFEWDGQAFLAPTTAAPGYWNLRLSMVAEDGTKFRRRIPLMVKP